MGRDLATALAAIDGWPVGTGAAGAVTRDGASATAGTVDEVLPLASVSKLLTATAVLVAVEEGSVALDEPAGPPGATVRDLLAHSSGLGPEADDPVTEPRRRRVYSNAGYEVLGALVAERAGIGFDAYLHEGVVQPLGLTATALAGSPAHGASSTVRDLLVVAGELLGAGQLLAPETLTEATSVHLPDLAGVLPGYGRQDPNPWGLGPEIRGSKSPHWTPAEASPGTFGHFGRSGTMLWVDPDAGVALVALTDEPFGQWAIDAWPALGAAVLAATG